MSDNISSSQSWHHPLAKSAFSESGASGLYDRARPSYPSECIDFLQSLPYLTPRPNVVELGSGTGIFTRLLLSIEGPARPSKIVAVEPSVGMRQGFATAIQAFQNEQKQQTQGEHSRGSTAGSDASTNDVQVECVDGTFDNIPAPSASVDLLVVAQAYHWIGADIDFQDRCIAEAARVLKPNGHFALIWNLEDREAAEWVAQLRDTYEVYEHGTPQYRLGLWRTIFKTPSFQSSFTLLPSVTSPPSSASPSVEHPPTLVVKREIPVTLDQVRDRVLSKSYVTALSDAEKAQVAAKVDEVWRQGRGIHWLDKEQGIAGYPYATDLFVMQRK